MSANLKLVDDAPEAEAPRHAQTIFERAKGDFAQGLREAERIMARWVRTKANQDATHAAWTVAVERKLKQAQRLIDGRTKACARYDHDLRFAEALLDGFMEAFADQLPRKAVAFSTPEGEFRRRKCRATAAKEADSDVLPILRELPYQAMEQAIHNKQSVNWQWIKAHLVETEDGPVLRWVDQETGEITTIPAVVEREAVGDEVALTPILRTVPPEKPYTVTITPASEGPTGDDQEEDTDGE